MKYVALLRGINVGGNNHVSMAELKNVFEIEGFTNVQTYINSGNVMFESSEKNVVTLTPLLEKVLMQHFHYSARVVLRSLQEMKDVMENVPYVWNTSKEYRCYVGFFSTHIKPEEVFTEVQKVVHPDIDIVTEGKTVVYMTTLHNGLRKSGFGKLIGTKAYSEMTIRNYNTVKKICSLMSK